MKRPAGDDGFTLVEVIMATVILAVIFPAFAGSMLVVMKVSRGAGDTISAPQAAHDAALTFGADAASATTVGTGDPTSSPCASGGAVVLSFRWTDAGTATDYVADWSRVGSAPGSLHRLFCSRTGGGAYSLLRDNTIVPTLAASGALSALRSPNTATPTTIALTVTDASTPAYVFKLSGTRRTS